MREGVHPLRARAGDRLVCRHPHAREPRLLVERLQDAGERDRAAVRVRDDPVALEGLERTRAVDLGHDEWVAVHEAVGRRLVHADRARGRGNRHELVARRRSHGEEKQVDVAGAERLGRRLLDEELAVAKPNRRTGGAWRRERPHVLVAALREQRERHRPDRAGRADDADPRLCVHHHVVLADGDLSLSDVQGAARLAAWDEAERRRKERLRRWSFGLLGRS